MIVTCLPILWLADDYVCITFPTYSSYLISRFKVNMSDFPIISKIHGALSELDFFKQSHPLNQPDCPPELKDKNEL